MEELQLSQTLQTDNLTKNSQQNKDYNNSQNQQQLSQRSSGMEGGIRKSARFIEQEQIEKSATKIGKSFKETIKFDASLYQSGESDSDNEQSNNFAQNSQDDQDGDYYDQSQQRKVNKSKQARKSRKTGNDENDSQNYNGSQLLGDDILTTTQRERKNNARNLQKKIIAPSINKNQALIDEIKKREMEASKSRKFINIKVDPMCELAKVQVMDDYSCYMQQADISYNDKGEHTKFYKIQLLVRDDQKKWFVWVQQGKVGSELTAPTRVNDFFNKYDAMVEFEQKFFDKTANKWKDRDYFQQKPGKFIYMKRDQDKEIIKRLQETEKQILEIINESFSNHEIKKVQDQGVFELVKMAWDMDMMKVVMRDMQIDVDRLPMGKLTKEQVHKAIKVLKEIQNVLLQEKSPETLINALTNDFYNIIPHNFGMKKPQLIDHLLRIKEKIKILENIQHIANVQNLLINSEYELKASHPIDVQYSLMSSKIESLSPKSNIYKVIETAFNNTQADSHSSLNLEIANIFTVQKISEKLRFMPYDNQLHNKFMLWHGVKQCNLASILREGLKLPSDAAPTTNFMFGKGIYFNDCSSKAARESILPNYKSGDGFILLCEVALGDMHKAFGPYQHNKPPNYCHSVYGVGLQKPKLIGIKDLHSDDQETFRPNELTICSPQAVFLHTGKLAPNTDLQEKGNSITQVEHKLNDYIVFDEAQVKISYLVHFKYDLN